MENTNCPIESFLENCTPAQALTTAKALIDRCTVSLTDPECAEALQVLALRLTEMLPMDSQRIAADLQMLVDLLTAQRLCAEFSPSLAQEYTQCLQQTQQIKEQQALLQQQAQQIKNQEALLRDYQAQPRPAEDIQQLQIRNARQEQTIRRLQEEATQLKSDADRWRTEAMQLKQEIAQAANAPTPTNPDVAELEKAMHILNQQYKAQLLRNTEERRENNRLRAQLRDWEKTVVVDPEEYAKLKERVLRQEQTIRYYQKAAK